MQPTYIKVMWICVAIVFFGVEVLGLLVTKQEREYFQFAQFVLAILAFSYTLLANKIRTGIFFPGIKRKHSPHA
jgi:hypothetical protein